MIQLIEDTSRLSDVYFEDKDDVCSSQETCYLVYAWYFYYFATLEEAQIRAKKLGMSTEIVSEIGL